MIRNALHSYKAINTGQTLCTFINSDGKMLNRTLAISVFEIQQWIDGVDIKIAMPRLSTQMHNLFYKGAIDNDVDKLFENFITDDNLSDFQKQFNKEMRMDL